MSRGWPLRRPSPELAGALREATRIDAVAHALGPGTDPAAVRRELEQRPPAAGRPRRTGTSRVRRLARPYGEVWSFRRAPFYATRPVPFLAIPLDGATAIVFDPRPRPDLAAPAARYALDRLAAARGWDLPADLARPAAAVALLDLVLADPDRFLPAGPSAVCEPNVFSYAGRWDGSDEDDELVIRLAPLTLTAMSRRYGPIGAV